MKGVYELKDTLKRHDQTNSPDQQPSPLQPTTQPSTQPPTTGIPPYRGRFGKVFDVGEDELRLVESSNEIISFQSLKKKIHQSQFAFK